MPSPLSLIDQLTKAVFEALSDDFNAARALAAVFEFIWTQNVAGKSGKLVHEFFARLDEVFGVFQTSEESINQEIDKLIAESGKGYGPTKSTKKPT